jgi:outer membrane protein OmpA-like peptidoglycan-associated protein
MRKNITLLLLFVCIISSAQKISMDKKDITPRGISNIGGISVYDSLLYIMLPSNIRYEGRIVEASESKSIAQKYRVWDIYSWDYENGLLENMSHRWPTPDASPNGFTIVDDSTVVYINTKMKPESNQVFFKNLFRQFARNKSTFVDPSWDKSTQSLFFSSDHEGGKGAMDIWKLSARETDTGAFTNFSEVNSLGNEISPSLQCDTILAYCTETQPKDYDIHLYDMKNKEKLFTHKTPNENEFFLSTPSSEDIYYVSTKEKQIRIYKGTWRFERIGKIENIQPMKTEPIVQEVVAEKEPEIALKAKVNYEEPDFRITNYFGLARFDLTPMMKDSLDKIAAMVKNNPSLNIVICGHASPDGPENLNMMLSYYRANEAYKWLAEKNIDPDRIFRIYGGEYLYDDTVKARMFSIFPIQETDIPDQTVIVPASQMGNPKNVYTQFGTDEEDSEYIRFSVMRHLPVTDRNLMLIPIKNIHFVQQGETLFSLAKKYETTVNTLVKANNLANETVPNGQILLIPR